MDSNEMISVLNGMCERCLMKGMVSTIDDAKILCETFDRFRNTNYKNDEEYSRDILYLYDLATKLHESGNTSIGESYSIYSALLHADRVDFVETEQIEEPIKEESVVSIKTIKLNKNKSKKSKVNDGVVDVSDIVVS